MVSHLKMARLALQVRPVFIYLQGTKLTFRRDATESKAHQNKSKSECPHLRVVLQVLFENQSE